MRFEYPLAILAAVVPLWIWWIATHREPRVDRLAVAWRVATAVMLILAATGLALSTGAAPITAVVALDRSASMPPRAQERAVARMSRFTATMKAGDRLGLVSFAADASVEWRPLEGGHIPAGFTAVTDSQTDLGAALRLARAVLPPDGSRRIVLVSDGFDTAGGAEREARFAAAAGIPIDVIEPAAPGLQDPLRVTRLSAPVDAAVGEPYRVSVEVVGTPGARGTLIVSRDDAVIGTHAMSVDGDGTGGVVLEERQREAGAFVYRAAIDSADAPGDAHAPGAVVVVEGLPGILYVSDSFPTLGPTLTGAGFRVTHVAAADVPTTGPGLSSFAGIVLDDVPAERLPDAAPEAFARYVEQMGGGMLILGTSRTLTLGGYPTTSLERILPVDLRPRAGQRASAVELVVVFDKSGSMAEIDGGIPKIEIARQAVLRAVEVMPPSDAIGVLAFASKPETVAPLAAGRDMSALRTALREILPGGSTSVAPAFERAIEWLRAADRPQEAQRHILLISDGRTSDDDAERTRFLARTGGAEVSVVAIGPNANRRLLEELARSSGGRAYFPDDLRDLPGAVAREVARTSGGGVVQERFVPRAAAHPILAGIDSATLPAFDGYVVSAAKPFAEMILASHLGDPILGAWRAGLGRVALFTADLASPWSASLQSWRDNGRLWTQTVRWLSRRDGDRAIRLQIDDAGHGPRLQVDAEAPDGSFLSLDAMTAVVHPPGGTVTEVALEPVAPGRYEALLPNGATGSYVVGLTARDRQSGAEHRVVRALYWSADRERRTRGTDRQLLRRLASLTGGRMLREDEGPFDAPRPSGYRHVSMWAAALALAMFVLDISTGDGIDARKLRRWRRSPSRIAVHDAA